MKIGPKNSWMGTLLFGMGLVLVEPANAEKIYVYQDINGSRLITNTPSTKSGIKLVKTYEPVASIRSLPRTQRSPRTLKPVDSDYDLIIQQIANQYNQDQALIKAITHIESGFNKYAVSPKGALGLMQLMPGTADQYEVDDPFNAKENIQGGTHYFSQLMQRYNNDVRKALAAYNAGEKAVDDHAGIPPYPETQSYVKSVLNLHRRYQDIRQDIQQDSGQGTNQIPVQDINQNQPKNGRLIQSGNGSKLKQPESQKLRLNQPKSMPSSRQYTS